MLRGLAHFVLDGMDELIAAGMERAGLGIDNLVFFFDTDRKAFFWHKSFGCSRCGI